MIYDLDGCPFSHRHGLYGGYGGDKDGIVFKGDNWIVKYPKSTRDMQQGNLASYTTSPLSEYIGSHIYQILGYDTHETELGFRNGKIVVACKDFCEDNERLAEVRSIKNAANREVALAVGEEIPKSVSGDRVNIDEILLHLNVNPIMKRVPGLEERFWDMAVIDVLIENNDRNNGNWGVILSPEKARLAPIYDNGNSFYTKLNDSGLQRLKDAPDAITRMIGGRTAFEKDDHVYSAKKFLNLDHPGLKTALKKNVPLIYERKSQILGFIDAIPSSYRGQSVISDVRKDCYKAAIEARIDHLLIPTYEKFFGQMPFVEHTSDPVYRKMEEAWYNYFNLPRDMRNGIRRNDTKMRPAIFEDLYLAECKKAGTSPDKKISSHFWNNCVDIQGYEPRYIKSANGLEK